MNLRIGHGYDVHRLVPGRALILGGVQIDWRLGLDGHSDADVLTHAVMDALLGAAGLGDIGALFPDNDPQYFGIDSTILLRRVGEKIAQAGYQVANIDVTMIAQQPRLAPYLPAMEETPRPGTGPGPGADQYQSDDGGAPRLHRPGRGHGLPRRLPAGVTPGLKSPGRKREVRRSRDKCP